jgi:hypothetical protein
MIESLRRLFGLTPPAAPTGAAWRSYPVTPQSLVTQPVGVDRQIGGVGEIGMGGPNYWTMLLADGAMLGGVCGGVSDVGRLRVALTLTRQGETLQVYDPDAQVIHTLDPAPRTANDEARLREACRRAVRSVALRSVRGLRLEDAVEPPERLTLTLPSGRTLEARLVLPDDLRGTVEVEGLLRDPPYGLWLDGAATGLHVADLDEVVEAADGQIVLRGRRLDADGRVIDGMWLARRDGRFGRTSSQPIICVQTLTRSHDPPFAHELDHVRQHRMGGRWVQPRVHRRVEAGHHGLDAGEPGAERFEDLSLARPAVGDIGVDERPTSRIGAPWVGQRVSKFRVAHLLQAGEIVAHVAVRRGDHRRRPAHDVVAG